jgi:hypothetical protein
MKPYNSFVSEHTIEYVLVPQLIKILRQQYKVVVPIYPWITKEGSNLSKAIHKNDLFKMIGLFPRRPKFLETDNNKIFIKINLELLESYQEASKFNVPLIAGCPLIRNLWELEDEIECVWINLNVWANDSFLLETSIDLANDKKHPNSFFESDKMILDYFNENCKSLNFNQALDIIKTLKNSGVNKLRSFFGTIYKPTYFLLK